jgi:hypothetical protein
MKIKNFLGYEIDVKAYEAGKSNNDELIHFLNAVSLMADYAAKFKECQGHNFVADEYKECSNTLYEICKKAGAYDDIT